MNMHTQRSLTWPIRSGYDVVRILLAVVLLTAAGLKCVQLSTEPVIGHSIFDSRWLLMATVEFELFFGFWLLANITPRLTWLAALGCFSMFTCISLYKALSGYASCGCFGRVEVNPWYTSTMDMTFVVSLAIWRPRELLRGWSDAIARFPSTLLRAFLCRQATLVLFAWLAIGLPAGYAMGSYVDTTLSDVGTIIGDGKIVVLEPEKWIGKRFPLLDYIDIGNKLRDGVWTVLFYRHDCPHCQRIVPRYEGAARRSCLAEGKMNFALVDIVPHASSEHALIPSMCCCGQLDDAREWLVEVPVAIEIANGFVLRVDSQQQLLNQGIDIAQRHLHYGWGLGVVRNVTTI